MRIYGQVQVLVLGLLMMPVVALSQAAAEVVDEAPPLVNGTPVYLSTVGGDRIGGTSGVPTEAPVPSVLPSGVTEEMQAEGVHDPGDTLEMLMAWRYTHQTNTAVFGLWDEGGYDAVLIRFRLRVGVGGLGGAVALLPVELVGDTGGLDELPEGFSWDEPNFPDDLPGAGVFAVAFDTHNPPTANWFNALGNVYDRPQHEVSLHYAGVEIANVLCPTDYRSTIDDEDVGGGFRDVSVRIENAVGGGYATVTIGETVVMDRVFVPGYEPAESRLAFGGSSSDHAAAFDVRAVSMDVAGRSEPAAPPVRARLADEVFVHGNNRTPEFEAVLPEFETDEVGRIILTLTLDPGLGGCDPWDKKAALYVWDEGGTRFEVVRFITSFGTPYQWQVDVTDYACLLRGEVKAGLFVDTWMFGETPETTRGWTISADLDYYEGVPEREVVAIENLWVGEPEYGNPDQPMSQFFDPRKVTLPEGAHGALLRMSVTGHGMHPATYNAAEFMPADRTLVINDQTRLGNLLWKEDCYLNPCRPQGGTWKFDRAGWAPGSIVERWDVDLTAHLNSAGEATLGYVPMAYENLARETSDQPAPTHWVETQVFYYR